MPKVLDLSKFSLNPFITQNPALPTNYIRNAYYNGIGRSDLFFKFKTNL